MASAWRAITEDPGAVLVPLAVAAVSTVAFAAVVSFVVGLGEERMRLLLQQRVPSEYLAYAVPLSLSPLSIILQALVEAFVLAGASQFCLRVARGMKPGFEEVFAGGPAFVPMLFATLLHHLGAMLGFFCCCLLPGMVFAVGWMLYAPALVDKDRSPLAALKFSWELFRNQPWSMFTLAALHAGIVVLGLLACCIGVVLVSLPLLWLSSAYAYLKATGEETLA